MRNLTTTLTIATLSLSLTTNSLASEAKEISAKEKTLTDYYLSSLRRNINNLQELISELSPNKDSLNGLIGQEDSKDALLKNINRVVKLKNEEIFEYQKLTKRLEKKVHELSFKEKLLFEMQKRELASSIDDRSDLINGMKTSLKEKDEKIIELKKLVGSQRHKLEVKIKKLEHSLMAVRSAKNTAPETTLMAQEVMDLETKNFQLNRKYAELVKSNERTSTYFNKKMKGQGDGSYKELIELNQGLESSLRLARTKISELEVELKVKTEELMASEERNKRLEDYSNDINRRYQDLQFKYQNVTKEVEFLKSDALAKSSANAQNRLPASLNTQDSNSKISKELAKKIGNFNIGDNLEFNEEKAVLTLVNDLIFKNDSSKIDTSRKEEIKILLSTLSKRLFEDRKLKNRVKFINFVGHSSPRYKGEVINPIDASKGAFDHNMNLSYKRAKAFADYILSEEFGDFPYKDKLKEKIQVSGRGFSEPILASREPASDAGPCGNFDCDKSRRVEIFLELK